MRDAKDKTLFYCDRCGKCESASDRPNDLPSHWSEAKIRLSLHAGLRTYSAHLCKPCTFEYAMLTDAFLKMDDGTRR